MLTHLKLKRACVLLPPLQRLVPAPSLPRPKQQRSPAKGIHFLWAPRPRGTPAWARPGLPFPGWSSRGMMSAARTANFMLQRTAAARAAGDMMERFLSLPLHAFVVRILCAWTAASREPAALLVRSCLPTHSKISPMPEDASAASADSPSSASKTACIASAAACAPARLEPSDCVQRTQRARVRACPDCLPACLLCLHPCARASMRPARACVCASSHIVMCLSAQEGEWAGRVDGRPWVGGGRVRPHACCMCVCVCVRPSVRERVCM